MKMKPLTEYTKNGYHFSLIKRQGDAAIFRGVIDSSHSINWEVICIQKSAGGPRIFNTPKNSPVEVVFEPKEYPPGNNEWGTKGWTCLSLEAAEEKLQLLATAKTHVDQAD